MFVTQKSPYCIDTISAEPSAKLVLTLWQHALQATSMWFTVSLTVFARTLWLCLERKKQRHALSHLDTRLLADIGVDRPTALHETRKPCWKK